MGTGIGPRVRALGIAVMLALVATAGVACGSDSSTSSSKPVHVSLAEATKSPCRLVTLGQANAILNTGDTTGNITADPQVTAGLLSDCVYTNLPSSVIVALNFGSEAESFAVSSMKTSAGIMVAGHAGVCGADAAVYGKGVFGLAVPIVEDPIESQVWLSVDGAKSCAVDAKFAQAVFANL